MAEARTDREQQTDTRKEVSPNRQIAPGRERPSEIRRRSSFDPGNPFDLMRRITEQMFGPLGLSGARGLTPAVEQWTPLIEIFERDGKLHVTADLPGMTKDDVRVEVRDNNLIIEGERKEEKKEDREGYFLTERTYGRFSRVIPLPDDIDPNTARASFRDGVLELTMDLPRNHPSHSRSIPIEEAKGEAGGKNEQRT